MHHPLFSSGYHGSDASMRPIWDVLYANGVDIVIAGHDHDYERFAKQRPDGTLDWDRGIREFVVGTGGKSLRSFATPRPNSQVRRADRYGVLKLTFHPRSYDWAFIDTYANVLDSSNSTSSKSCH